MASSSSCRATDHQLQATPVHAPACSHVGLYISFLTKSWPMCGAESGRHGSAFCRMAQSMAAGHLHLGMLTAAS